MKSGSLSKHANIEWEFVADVDDKLISNRYGAGVGTSEGLAAVFRDVAARVSRPSSLSHACPARARPRNIAHSRFYPLPYFLQKIIRIFIDIFLYNNNHSTYLSPQITLKSPRTQLMAKIPGLARKYSGIFKIIFGRKS